MNLCVVAQLTRGMPKPHKIVGFIFNIYNHEKEIKFTLSSCNTLLNINGRSQQPECRMRRQYILQ